MVNPGHVVGYNKRNYKGGETFEVDEKDAGHIPAKAAQKVNLPEVKTAPKEEKPRTYRKRVTKKE